MTGIRPSNPENRECRKFDEVIAENPPRITWVKNKRGVLVAAEIQDPHTDHKFRDKGDAA